MKIEEGQQILKALHNGNVPAYQGAKYIMCGHEEERDTIYDELKYIKFNENDKGHSGFKMIYGPYGSGKSFLCEVLKEDALKDNFVISEIVISKNTQLHNFETIYNKIMSGLRTDSFREFSAFRIIIENWIEKEKLDIINKFNLEPDDIEEDEEKLMNKIKDKISLELQKANTTNVSIINSITTFAVSLIKGNNNLAQKSLGWFAGDTNITSDIKKSIGVKGSVDKSNVFEFLKTLLYIIQKSDYSGLFVIIDEVETVRKERKDVRYQAYENLRLLIDMVSKDNLPGCYLLFTGTEELIEDDEKGIKEHDALYTRIEPIKLGDIRVLEQPLIKLSRFCSEQLIEVAKKVRNIHGIVYEWNAEVKISDKFIEQYVTNFTHAFGKEVSILPRTFLKNFVFVLEASKREPISKIKSLLNISEEQIKEITRNIEIYGKEVAVEIEL
ncbi:DUF2791 family P-loop domain-containing protein [Terrisporobacter glycolicus]|nr:DUF2791 family P-loop domain-containing protein [Terrisporobacter glycolicus]